jgi:hypothetical protein
MAIIQRLVNIQFTGAPQVQNTGIELTQSQITQAQNFSASVSGLRVSARVTVFGEASMGMANARIWGMPQDQMNQLSTLGMNVLAVPDGQSKVTITAGDFVNGMYQVFQGVVLNAWSDYSAAPQVPFNIECKIGPDAAVASTPATSINGAGDVAGMMQKLATAAGYTFTNNGVNAKIRYPYFAGSPRDQMLAIVDAALIDWDISLNNVTIFPRNGYRDSSNITISPGNGLVGYPSIIFQGIACRVLFNPQLRYGSQVTIQGSSITPANNTWKICKIEHEIDSLMPNGKWFSMLELRSPILYAQGYGQTSAVPSAPGS